MNKEYFIIKGHDYGIKEAIFGATYWEGILAWTFSITGLLGNCFCERLEPTIYSQDILSLRNFRPKRWTEACDRTIAWKEGYNWELGTDEASITLMGGCDIANGTLILGKPEGNLVPISIKGDIDLGNRTARMKAAAMAEFTGVHFLEREDHAYTIEEVVQRLGPEFDLSDYDLVSCWDEQLLFYWNYLVPKAASKEYRHRYDALKEKDGA